MQYGTNTESEVTSAILAAAKRSISQIAEFVVVIDDRRAPITFGYIVEIAGEIGSHIHSIVPTEYSTEFDTGRDANLAPQYAADDLIASSDHYCMGIRSGMARKPTIRLVQKGTFAEFRALKCEKANIAIPQVKVLVVLLDQPTKEWFLERVVMEL